MYKIFRADFRIVLEYRSPRTKWTDLKREIAHSLTEKMEVEQNFFSTSLPDEAIPNGIVSSGEVESHPAPCRGGVCYEEFLRDPTGSEGPT